ncbi:hypothetical protein EJ03DRAFT_370678 [Teratosphaeria nubilosa]|uniref:Concanavalin A-like lectin/glucanase n=1 Tax=Teratosphaeria nubilosa TaxID=161662 RepID=A0A6G1LMM9_9PEZI|nr:hypothetical protein EJ03DRAFT_370678 [Teratosphaeria nubilosa]
MARNGAPLTIVALAIVGLAAAQCDPTNVTTAPCAPIEGITAPYSVDFTTISSVPSEFIIASYEDSFLHFGSNGLEFRLEDGYSAPYIWTNKYMHYGTASAIIQTAPGIGVISSAVLLSDDGDEIDYEMSGNDFTYNVPTVQTNYYGKAIDGDWDRGTQPQVSANMTSHFFNFTQVWTPTSIQWILNGTVIRTQLASDCDTGNHQYPQTPARYHIGVWDAGNPTSPWYTAQWAGGYTETSSFPSSMYLKSIYIQPWKSCAYYKYSDTTGSSDSVECLSSIAASAASTGTPTQASNAPKVPTATTNGTTCVPMPTQTQEGTSAGCATYYQVQSGDDCATIATSLSVNEDDLKSWNPQAGSDCDNLWANYYICVSTPCVCNGTTSSSITATSTVASTSSASSWASSSSQALSSFSSSGTISASSTSPSSAQTSDGSSTAVSLAPSRLQTVASQASIISASSIAASGASSAAVPCATGTLGGNAIILPGLGDIVPAGKPYNITWTPSTSGNISLLLLKGPSTNMVIDSTIANNIDNSGYFLWTPSTSLVSTDDANGYGIELIVYGTGDYQYSTQFGISNDQYTPPAMMDLPVSTDGTCGASAQTVCKGSVFGDCCSAYGYCGNTTDFCSVTAGCLWQYGRCQDATSDDASSSSSITIAATSPGSSSSGSGGATQSSSSSSSSKSSSFSSSSSKPSSITSTSYATATGAIKCPDSNSTVYQINSKSFLIECGIDHAAGDLTSTTVNSLSACIAACASNDACVDVSLSGVACYLKSSVGAPVYNGVYGAKLLTTSTANPSTTSSAISTSTLAVKCPDSNSTIHQVNGKSFLIECGIDHAAGDMTSVTANSLSDCIAACASHEGCVDVSLSGVACYLKSNIGAPVYNGVYGAKLIDSTSTSASTAPATTSSSSSVHTSTEIGRVVGTSAASSASSTEFSSSSSPSINAASTFTTSAKVSLGALSTLSSAVATVSAPSGDPSGFAYTGCYSEVSGRALSEKSTAQNGMTNDVCAAFCKDYAWFATEYGNECYCGNTLHSASKPCTDGRCKMTCAGNRGKICGGSNGLSLYKSCTTKAQGEPAVINGTTATRASAVTPIIPSAESCARSMLTAR